MRRTKIVATIGPASREPETLVRMVEAGLDVARLNFSHGDRELHAENAERVRAAAASGRPAGGDPPGPARTQAAHRRADATDIVELKPGEHLVLACGSTEPGDEQRMSVSWGGLAGRRRSRRRHLPGRRRHPPAGPAVRDGECEIDTAGRGRRHGRLAAGPEHPRLHARPGRGARGGSRHAALRRVDRGRRRRAVVRAHRRGRRDRPPPHPAAAGGQDREAAGRRRGARTSSGPPTRDGRAGRPRDRAPDRGRCRSSRSSCCGSPGGLLAPRSPPPRCSTRWSPPRARPALRSPTWPTRSSTGPTR